MTSLEHKAAVIGLPLDGAVKKRVMGVEPEVNDIYAVYSLRLDPDLVVVPSRYVLAYRMERPWTVVAHSLARAARAVSRLAATVASPSQAPVIKTAEEARRGAMPPLSVARGTHEKTKRLPSSAVIDDATAGGVVGESFAGAVGPFSVNGSASLSEAVGVGVATASGGAVGSATAAAAGKLARCRRRRRSQRECRGCAATARRTARAELRQEAQEKLAQTSSSACLVEMFYGEAMRAAGANGATGAHGECARRRRRRVRRRQPPIPPPAWPPLGATLSASSAAYAEQSGSAIMAGAQASLRAMWEGSQPAGSEATPEVLFEGTSLKQPTSLDEATAAFT